MRKLELFLRALTLTIAIFSSNQSFATTDFQAGQLPIQDLEAIPALFPTTYHVTDETSVSCIGWYMNHYYNSAKKNYEIKTPAGKTVGLVCERFAAVLAMEGSGKLGPSNGGITVNWAGNYRYKVMQKCTFGEGVRHDLCLLPFYTIAADLYSHKVGDIIYIPSIAEKKLKLPDGSLHTGIFEVRDTGDAFIGAGPSPVDFFVGTQPDHDNVFINAGIQQPVTYKAYKLYGKSKAQAIEFLQQKYPELY